jgi:ATP-binding cassette, sub-family E, member 1
MTRIAVIEAEKCNQTRCGGLLCAKVCPVNRTGKDCVYEGEDKKAKINEELCIGCGICVMKCPTNAITIVNLPEAFNATPIHKYGESGFQLYDLPIPIFGKVVGLVGKNGIGKSTAMKILSGMLKPNFKTSNEATIDEIIKHFKGTEAQLFFERLRDKKITISYKPQQVELIAKAFSGTVRELLSKVNAARLDEMAVKLELTEVLDRDISKISGGELQRVAIAATIMKEANVYCFDEPTNYLDIKQRLKVSKIIKELAAENTAVILIEHDLIILDYIADIVHIMYGKENAYGIVSQPKTTKVGINIYLGGYLKDENVRFRDKAITFDAKPPMEITRDTELVQWPAIKKELGTFRFEATPGIVHQHDIIGVLGENGIGKTTFMRELAQLDATTKHGKLRISYKPQYIPVPDVSVLEYLGGALQYEQQLMKPLELHELLERQLNELSGGQLQRVAIAKCLGEEADLYLMDEPSAYLDVEQRLLMSKIIRDMMQMKGKACLVVDHDLLFIDYIADKLTVFTGKPAVHGTAQGPYTMAEGMNVFLRDLNITFRRDEESHRPRINKEGSVKDKEQKAHGKLYYTG